MTAYTGITQKTASRSFVHQYPLVAFFALVFALTWPFLIVDALGSHGILPFRLPIPVLAVTGYMPTCSALIVTGLTKGKAGIRALLGKLLVVRVGLRWYAFAIFGFAGIYTAAIQMYNWFSGSPALPILSADTPSFSSPLEMMINIAVTFLIIGIINGEELAWRGFALPRLQARWNALTSSVILGAIWALFHLPLFYTLTGSSQADMSFIGFTISTISLAVLYTWMYNHTRGSVLLAYLLHAATNTWSVVFSIDHGNPVLTGIVTGLISLLAVVVVVVYKPENLTRNTPRISE